MNEEYFVDTSAWISYLQDPGSPFGPMIDELVDENRIHIDGIVLAELLTGTKSQAELDGLTHALTGLKFVPADRDSSLEAGRNGRVLRKANIAVPLTDVIIATDCIRNGLVLIATDMHYEKIAVHLPLKLYGGRRGRET